MSSLAGFKGGRLRRPSRKAIITRKLNSFKDEIITYAVDNYDRYDSEWLAEEVCEIWWEDLPEDITPKEVEEIIKTWDSEIQDAIKDSFEPTALEEAREDLMRETLFSLKNSHF